MQLYTLENGKVVILTILSSQSALEFDTSGATSDDKFANVATFPSQCNIEIYFS